MRSKTLIDTHRQERGFVALISVMLLTAGVVAFSMVTLSSAVLYADMVDSREIRIQARLNLDACLDTAQLMMARDHFMSGTVILREFGCVLSVTNNLHGHARIGAVSTLSQISQYGEIEI